MTPAPERPEPWHRSEDCHGACHAAMTRQNAPAPDAGLLSRDIEENWLVLTDPDGASRIVAEKVDPTYADAIVAAWKAAAPQHHGHPAALASDAGLDVEIIAAMRQQPEFRFGATSDDFVREYAALSRQAEKV